MKCRRRCVFNVSQTNSATHEKAADVTGTVLIKVNFPSGYFRRCHRRRRRKLFVPWHKTREVPPQWFHSFEPSIQYRSSSVLRTLLSSSASFFPALFLRFALLRPTPFRFYSRMRSVRCLSTYVRDRLFLPLVGSLMWQVYCGSVFWILVKIFPPEYILRLLSLHVLGFRQPFELDLSSMLFCVCIYILF